MKAKTRWRRMAWIALKKEKDDIEKSYSNLESADPELCIKLLQFPSVHNFHGIQKKIEKCDKEWMQDFLIQNGLSQLFLTLERLAEQTKKGKEIDFLAETELVQCVTCLKAIMNSQIGLEFVISHDDCTQMLSKTLCNKNTTATMIVLELLAAMCMYSSEGRNRAVHIMEHFKRFTSQRYRFSMVMNELRASKNTPYRTSILFFINAVILSTTSLQERIRIRNEFIGLHLLDILSDLRSSNLSSDYLLVQIDAFHEHKQKDEDLSTGLHNVNVSDHKDVFFALFHKVSNTPQAEHFLAILQSLFQLNPDETVSDIAWEIMDKTAQRVINLNTKEEGKRLLKLYDKRSTKAASEEVPSLDATDGPASFQASISASHLQGNSHTEQNQSVSAGDLLTANKLTPSPPPPPPPPPPPTAGGVPPPPPPPIGNTEEVKKYRKTPKPSKKLRKVNWQKISTGIFKNQKDSVWKALEKGDYDIQPNYQIIETFFAQKVVAKRTEETDNVAKPKETEVTFIESQRSMNAGIFLRQFRKSNEEIVNALRKGDQNILTEEKLKRMLKFLPEQSEIEMIKGFTGEKSTLANVDHYFLLLSQVSHYKLRIKAGIAKSSFEESMEELIPSIQTVKQACEETLRSERLKTFLLLILKTGNFMNYGAFTGDAFGFKLTSLPKLSDTKSNQPGMTLLHCIVAMVEEKYPDLISLAEEMAVVTKCKSISLPQLVDDIKTLMTSIQRLEKKVKDASKDIKEQYKVFFHDANKRTARFQEDLKEIDEFSTKLAKYFSEDVKKFSLDDCLLTLANFYAQIQSARNDNKKRKEREEKKRRREELEKERKKFVGNRKRVEVPPKENVVDSLLSDIRKGFRLRNPRSNS